VEGPDDGVGVIDGDGPDVGQGLDGCCALLVLRVGHFDLELGGSRLDSVPSGQTRGEVHVSRHAEISRVDDFVGRWVVENCLGVDTGLVGESAESSDVLEYSVSKFLLNTLREVSLRC
jgi:hypothetical protein